MTSYVPKRAGTPARWAVLTVTVASMVGFTAGKCVADEPQTVNASHSDATKPESGLRVQGMHVVTHVQSTEMKYRREPDFSLGARVEVFLRNDSQQELNIPC